MDGVGRPVTMINETPGGRFEWVRNKNLDPDEVMRIVTEDVEAVRRERYEQERREAAAERTVRRQGEHEAGRLFAGEGRERRRDHRHDQAGRRCREEQRTSPGLNR